MCYTNYSTRGCIDECCDGEETRRLRVASTCSAICGAHRSFVEHRNHGKRLVPSTYERKLENSSKNTTHTSDLPVPEPISLHFDALRRSGRITSQFNSARLLAANMAFRSPFLELSNDVMLMIIDTLAISPPRLDSPNKILTPLKHLSATNQRLRQLVRPFLLEHIELDSCLALPNYGKYGSFFSATSRAIADLSAIPGVCNNIRRFSFHTQRDTPSSISGFPPFDAIVNFIGSLNNLQNLTICIDTTSPLFEAAIEASSGEILLRLDKIKTLHVNERNIKLLTYCPNVQHVAISRAPGETAYGSAFGISRPFLVAPNVIQLEIKGIVLLCRVARLIMLSLEFPNTECLRLTENYFRCFRSWAYRIGDNFKHIKVLAVSHRFFEQFVACGPRNYLDDSTPFIGADNFARLAFENIDTLEELWLDPDNIARRTRGSNPETSNGNGRGSQEDRVDPDLQTKADVSWVWTRPSDPLVRHVEWIV